jgi:hypothetical protein
MTIGPSGTFAYVAVVPESGIASLLSPRDTLFMARNSCGGLALSMVRDGQLWALYRTCHSVTSSACESRPTSLKRRNASIAGMTQNSNTATCRSRFG